jgi:hypothetical protein
MMNETAQGGQKRLNEKLNDCMKKQGFEAAIPDIPGFTVQFQLGFTATAEGYGIANMLQKRREEPPPKRQGMTEAEFSEFKKALYGNPPGNGGCFRDSRPSLRIAGFSDAVKDMNSRFFSDSRVLVLLQKWSRCMKGNNFQFEKPQEIQNFLAERMEELNNDEDGVAILRKEEVAIADAELTCFGAIQEQYVKLEKEYDSVLGEKYGGLFAEYEQNLTKG